MSSFAGREALLQVLERARKLGFLGPGPVADHFEHAIGYSAAVGKSWSGLALDLGSGGGVPGLVLAVHYSDTRWALLESQAKRAQFLNDAIRLIGIDDRVVVLHERAEVIGRSQQHRGLYGLVVARSFAAPAVTAECAAPLLSNHGRLIVSEPPLIEERQDRWSSAGLLRLGLAYESRTDGPPTLVVMRSISPCPNTFPRRVGVPSKRPLW